jgi:hypothetical protein
MGYVAYHDTIETELYGESSMFANLMVTPHGAYLRTWTKPQVVEAYEQCFYPIVRKHWAEQVGNADMIAEMTEMIDKWIAKYKRREIRAGHLPEDIEKAAAKAAKSKPAELARQWGYGT